MKPILTALAVVIFVSQLPALAQFGCATQVRSIKPLTPVGCSDTTALCLCGPNGTNCHWEWVCLNSADRAPARGIDPTAFKYQPPELNDPIDTMIKIEQLRQLQQQNRTRPQSPVAVPKQEALSPADPLKPEDTSTDGPLNGQLWRLISPEAKAAFILGFSEALGVEKGEAKSKYFPLRLQADELSASLDRFYENPENIIIPVFAALEVITLRSNGTDPQALEVRLSVYRRLAHLSAEELQKLIKGN